MQKETVLTQGNLELINKASENGKKPVHFIGMGGIGMSGLAKFLLELGYKVSGSDIKESAYVKSISDLGGSVYVGHKAENIGEAAVIVVSSAIKKENPELIEAKNKNLPIIHRSQVLEALMDGLGLEKPENQISIGVSGTHGKTTTSGMISMIFEHADTNPSIVVGGQLPLLKTNSKLGAGKYFVSELDESDGSIVIYNPSYTIVTNLEADHLDHYENGFEQLLNTFEGYVNNLKTNGKIVMNADCAGNRELLKLIDRKKVILYSTNPQSELYDSCDYKVKEIELNGFNGKAQVYKKNENIGELNLIVPGVHNISNALAATAIAVENGIEFKYIAEALKQFSGMKRRFQTVANVNEITIVDDYAHHPTEVKATLKSAKNIVKTGNAKRIAAIFQPHRYSRLAGLWKDFTECFTDADLVYVCDVYAAGESPIDGKTAENFCKEVKHPNCKYISGNLEEVAEAIHSEFKQGDIVLTMGAGNITELGSILEKKLLK